MRLKIKRISQDRFVRQPTLGIKVNMLSAWEIRRSQDTQFGASGGKESPATMVSIIFVILSSYY